MTAASARRNRAAPATAGKRAAPATGRKGNATANERKASAGTRRQAASAAVRKPPPAKPASQSPKPASTSAKPASTKPAPRGKGSRAQRVEATRQALIHAATEVIGEVGYEKASIAKITSRARVAQGTFYTYFASRQDLFDRLLPDVGREMLAAIAGDVHGARSLMEVEERGLRSLFRYLVAHPGFYRLLNEAETLAQKAHRAHFRNLTEAYRHSLRVAKESGELPGYSGREVEALAYMLMGIRSYLILGFAREGRRIRPLPEWVTRTYLKFVGAALGLGTPRA